jgi:hypothetical protein
MFGIAQAYLAAPAPVDTGVRTVRAARHCEGISSPAGRHVVSGIVWIIYLAIIVAIIAGWWKVFTKAGEAGWKSIIPIYGFIVMLKIVGRDWWWVILLLIPVVGLIIWIIVALDLAKSFGRGTGFGIGLAFLSPIFGLMLGFGSDTYRGPAAKVA